MNEQEERESTTLSGVVNSAEEREELESTTTVGLPGSRRFTGYDNTGLAYPSGTFKPENGQASGQKVQIAVDLGGVDLKREIPAGSQVPAADQEAPRPDSANIAPISFEKVEL